MLLEAEDDPLAAEAEEEDDADETDEDEVAAEVEEAEAVDELELDPEVLEASEAVVEEPDEVKQLVSPEDDLR